MLRRENRTRRQFVAVVQPTLESLALGGVEGGSAKPPWPRLSARQHVGTEAAVGKAAEGSASCGNMHLSASQPKAKAAVTEITLTNAASEPATMLAR